MKDRLKKIGIWLAALVVILFCCGSSVWLVSAFWNALGTVVQQYILGAIALITAYYVISIIIGVIVIVCTVLIMSLIYSYIS